VTLIIDENEMAEVEANELAELVVAFLTFDGRHVPR
jgi:hypothetical protein